MCWLHDVEFRVWFTTFVVHDSCFNMFICGRSSWLLWVQDILGFGFQLFTVAQLIRSCVVQLCCAVVLRSCVGTQAVIGVFDVFGN